MKLKVIGIILFAFVVRIDLFGKSIIFDTDFGGDADDLGALAMLHNFQRNNQCKVLGIILWTNECYSVSAVDAVNKFYGYPNIPIGTRLKSNFKGKASYNETIANNFFHDMNYEDAEDAVILYRKLLSEQKDKSVTLVVVGPLGNIKNLINSEPDIYSDLSGLDLINSKVKELVIMGGNFPKGTYEWNFSGNMVGCTRYVLETLTEVSIVFCGYEIGHKIKTGKKLNRINKETPLYYGYLFFSQNAPWMKSIYKEGLISDNASYDQLAVLYAVEGGVGLYWDKVSGGRCVADDNGGNVWYSGDATAIHSYLSLIMEPDILSEIIYDRMLSDYK